MPAAPPASRRTPLAIASLLALALPVLPAFGQDDGLAPMGDAFSPDSAVIDVTQRVIGGNRSTPGQFPSIVALIDAGLFSPAQRQFCGGTVIASRWIVTAAHCLYDNGNRLLDISTIRVVEGVTDLANDPIGPDDEIVIVNRYVHPDYDHGAQRPYDDIALLELATSLDAAPAVLFNGDPQDHVGSTAVVAGWGATEFFTPEFVTYPDALHHASVPIVSQEACNAQNSYAGIIGEDQLCAGFIDGGVDSCLGDSGGPLYTGVNGRVELIGVTSFGIGCAEPNFYGIYTSVSSYLDWIRQYVGVQTLARGGSGLGGSDGGAASGGSAGDDDDGFLGASGTLTTLWLGLVIALRRVTRPSGTRS